MAKKLFCVVVLMLALVCVLASCGHEHEFGEWETTTETSCIAEGIETRICECGEMETRSISVKSHTEGEWITDKEANCTEDGSKHQICSICKTTINADTIFASGHHFSSWIIEREASCGSDGVKKRICECGESETVSFSSNHMLQFQSASKYPSGSMFALWYCDICNTIVEKPFTAVSATCEWVGTSFGSYANAKYKLNVSGGTGNYSYNIVVSEDMYSTGNYTVINGWTQTSPDINCYVDYETLNRFNPIAITVWINDGAGIVAYKFYFDNFCNMSCITSLYIPYTLN